MNLFSNLSEIPPKSNSKIHLVFQTILEFSNELSSSNNATLRFNSLKYNLMNYFLNIQPLPPPNKKIQKDKN